MQYVMIIIFYNTIVRVGRYADKRQVTSMDTTGVCVICEENNAK